MQGAQDGSEVTEDASGTSRRVMVAASVGTFIELYDVWLFGYFAVFLAGQFFPRRDPAAALLATFGIFAVGFLVTTELSEPHRR